MRIPYKRTGAFRCLSAALLCLVLSVSLCGPALAEGPYVLPEGTTVGPPPKEENYGSLTPEEAPKILEVAKPILKEKGITLEIVQLEDSITPNTGVIEGSLDANYFQHVP